jgi:RNA polymerase sigma-70 factor, ECF subfamily
MRHQSLIVDRPTRSQDKFRHVTSEEAESRRLRIQQCDFSELYVLYRRRVYSWCLRIARNSEDAEDLTQDTFVHLLRKIGSFRGESAFTTWLYRLTTNIALMRLRRKTHPQVSLEEISDSDPAQARCHYGLETHDRLLESSIARADLDRALEKVPHGFRRAIFLHDGEQYTHGEIAQLTGSAVGTSKSQLHKARQRLRHLLTSQCECLDGMRGRN